MFGSLLKVLSYIPYVVDGIKAVSKFIKDRREQKRLDGLAGIKKAKTKEEIKEALKEMGENE